MAYTYDEQILSDLHKDARGFRPRDGFWRHWNESTQDEKQAIWDGLCTEVEHEIKQERERHDAATADFERRILAIQECMRCDRPAAIRAYVESLDLGDNVNFYGASYICWEAGLPYSMAQVFVDAGAATHTG